MKHRLARLFGRIKRSERAKFLIIITATLLIGVGATALAKSDGWNPVQILQADSVTRLAAAVGGMRTDAVPVAIIDIDDAAFLSWGEPATVPRDHLARLLDLVRAGRPRAIILDIDFSHDRELEAIPVVDALKAYASIPDAPPLLLIRTVRHLPVGADTRESVLDRATVLDASVAAIPQARWVTALFESEDDWFFRRWRGYHAICADGSPRAYASVALATTAAVRDPERGLQLLDAWLERAATAMCLQPHHTGPSIAHTDPGWLTNAADAMTIPFAVGHTSNPARFGTTVWKDRRTPIFARLPADGLLRAAEPPDLDERVAIIGASFAASNDFHRTPLGTMPGVYVLANLVALGGGPLSESQWGGAKPFLIGVLLFALHLATTLLLRQPFASAAIVGTTLVLTVTAVVVGLAPYLVYEGAVIGLTLIAIFVLLAPVFEGFGRQGASSPDDRPFIRYILTDRALRRFKARRS